MQKESVSVPAGFYEKISRQSALGHWQAAGAVYRCRQPGEESVTRLWVWYGQFVRILRSTGGREVTGTDFVEAALTRWLGEPRRRSVAGKIGRLRRAKPCTFAIGWTALAAFVPRNARSLSRLPRQEIFGDTLARRAGAVRIGI